MISLTLLFLCSALAFASGIFVGYLFFVRFYFTNKRDIWLKVTNKWLEKQGFKIDGSKVKPADLLYWIDPNNVYLDDIQRDFQNLHKKFRRN